MTEEDYIKERLEDQLTWYSEKSRHNKRLFHRMRLVEIASAALIPFSCGVIDNIVCLQWVVGILGVLVTLASAATALFRYQEKWIQYTTTKEQLKHEKYMYFTNTSPYEDEKNKFCLLVERVESLISKENSAWTTFMMRSKKNMPHDE